MPEVDYLLDILILLTAAVISVPLFKRLGLGSVLGYLIAGSFVGPWGFGFITGVDEIQHIAEFGVVFLLFIMGIELKPARLWVMRYMVFGLGSAQVVITGLVLTGIALLFDLTPKIAVVVGFGLALSSTAFVLQILTERSELGSSAGRTAFSILLLQDLAVLPLLMLVTLFASDVSFVEGIEYAVLEAVLMVAAVILTGRYLLTPLLSQVASSRSTEVFIAAAVLVVLGVGWAMEEVGLSMALGAFLAGLMLADSRYRHQVIADIQPFRGILLGLFFMGVGMSINTQLFLEQWLPILGAVIALLTIKAAVIMLLCLLTKLRLQDNIRVSLLLSQSGEFGFVLFGLAFASGVMDAPLFQFLSLVIALTMVATPFVSTLSVRIGRFFSRDHQLSHLVDEEIEAKDKHVIIAGFGRVGRRVAKILDAAGVPYVALENSPDNVALARKQGFDVFYGDASRIDVLKAAGADSAAILVVTLDQPKQVESLVQRIHQHYSGMPIIARARDSEHCKLLLQSGASVTISEMLEAGLQLGSAALQVQDVPVQEIRTLLDENRQEYYDKLNGDKQLNPEATESQQA